MTNREIINDYLENSCDLAEPYLSELKRSYQAIEFLRKGACIIKRDLEVLEILRKNNAIMTFSHNPNGIPTEWVIRFSFKNEDEFNKVKRVLEDE